MSNTTFQKSAEGFLAFCELVKKLRDPISGCPWDLKQNHETLAKYMVEEAYEAATVMKENDIPKICDELGDVLLQVVLNSQIGSDNKTFTIDDVITSIHTKMLRRHPHVFGSEQERSEREIHQIMSRWEEIKRIENGPDYKSSYMEQKGVHKVFPSTTQAEKIGKAAHSIHFDWSNPDEVFDVVLSEIEELKAEWKKSKGQKSKELQSELGDVYFSLAQLCRHLKLDAEMLAMEGNQKFLKRFQHMEDSAKNNGEEITALDPKRLEVLWKEAKKSLR